MSTTHKHQNWVKIDFWVQVALVGATIGLSIFSSPMFLPIMAIPIGFWQSVGGLVHFFAFKKSNRKPYLLGVLAVGLIFFAMEQYHLMDATAMLLVVPLAVWSFALTVQDYYKRS